MKNRIKYIFILLFLAVTFVTDTPLPGWYQQTLPRSDITIQDLYFLDSLNGYVVTRKTSLDSAFIYKTTDGGSSWITSLKGNIYLTSIQFVNNNIGYSVGSVPPGIVMKTTNAGTNWFTVALGFGYPLQDLAFVNKDTGWTCSDDNLGGGLYKTTNGGMNWTQQLGGSYRPKRLFFLNNDTGLAVCNSNKLYRTTNSGGNWNQIYSFQDVLIDVYYSSKDTGWVVGGRNNGVNLLRSIDGGFTWDSVNCSKHFGGSEKIFMLTNTRGWVGTGPNAVYSTRDGYNWGKQNSPSFISWSVQFVDSLNGWAGYTSLIHSTDGGGPITYIGIKSSSTFVTAFDLKQNYPNPFNPTTKIMFDVKKNSRISLKVYSIDGREVDELLDYEKFDGGNSYYVDFDAGNLSSGVYLYQMTGWTDDKKEIFIDTKKMVLIK